ncbi:MAG: hypothetical protein HGA87_08065 [Desulfobulbaceae bacterium]|nr:hypothetical protein [Desulfobulbaceae bacterium]
MRQSEELELLFLLYQQRYYFQILHFLFLFHHLYSAHGNAVEGRSIVFASFAVNSMRTGLSPSFSALPASALICAASSGHVLSGNM